jgi:hypothetical protein
MCAVKDEPDHDGGGGECAMRVVLMTPITMLAVAADVSAALADTPSI